MEQGSPLVTIHMAASLDGFIARAGGRVGYQLRKTSMRTGP